jgi:hypothetical protein
LEETSEGDDELKDDEGCESRNDEEHPRIFGVLSVKTDSQPVGGELDVGDGIEAAEFVEDNDGRDASNQSILDKEAPSSFIRRENQCNGIEKKKNGITEKRKRRESADNPVHDGKGGEGEGDALVNVDGYINDYEDEVRPRLDNKEPMFPSFAPLKEDEGENEQCLECWRDDCKQRLRLGETSTS